MKVQLSTAVRLVSCYHLGLCNLCAHIHNEGTKMVLLRNVSHPVGWSCLFGEISISSLTFALRAFLVDKSFSNRVFATSPVFPSSALSLFQFIPLLLLISSCRFAPSSSLTAICLNVSLSPDLAHHPYWPWPRPSCWCRRVREAKLDSARFVHRRLQKLPNTTLKVGGQFHQF